MEAKQTAVQWLIEQLTATGQLEVPQGSNVVTHIIEEANEIFKEQIKSAFFQGDIFGSEYYDGVNQTDENYYNETFKTK